MSTLIWLEEGCWKREAGRRGVGDEAGEVDWTRSEGPCNPTWASSCGTGPKEEYDQSTLIRLEG